MRSLLFPIVFVCLFFATPAFAQRVVENESKIAFSDKTAEITLVVENVPATATVPGAE